MPANDWMAAAVRLGAQVDALAAIAAAARIRTEDGPVEPVVRDLLGAVVGEVIGPTGDDIDPGAAAQVVGLARTFLRQALDLIDDPGRRGGWDRVDVQLLQSIGRLSMGIADAIGTFEQLDPRAADRLGRAGARMLDIGTGAGWLAIALARGHPQLDLVGIDIFDPALDLARANVDAEGLADRIELRRQDAVALDEPDGYDAIWVPMPFLPEQVVPRVLAAAHRNLRPGGWVLPGVFRGPPGDLGQVLSDLRTVRSGGHPWSPTEVVELLTASGFSEAQEVPRSWAAPVRLFAARRL